MKTQLHSPRLSALVLALMTFGASAALADTAVNAQPMQPTREAAQGQERTASSDKVDAARLASVRLAALSNEPNWMGVEYTSK